MCQHTTAATAPTQEKQRLLTACPPTSPKQINPQRRICAMGTSNQSLYLFVCNTGQFIIQLTKTIPKRCPSHFPTCIILNHNTSSPHFLTSVHKYHRAPPFPLKEEQMAFETAEHKAKVTTSYTLAFQKAGNTLEWSLNDTVYNFIAVYSCQLSLTHNRHAEQSHDGGNTRNKEVHRERTSSQMSANVNEM